MVPIVTGALCDWCDHLTVVVVTNHYHNGYKSADWMCREHFLEYHPTLTHCATPRA
jgi:hypothetical protein